MSEVEVGQSCKSKLIYVNIDQQLMLSNCDRCKQLGEISVWQNWFDFGFKLNDKGIVKNENVIWIGIKSRRLDV